MTTTIRDEPRTVVWEHPLDRVERVLPHPRPPWHVRRRRQLLVAGAVLLGLVLLALLGVAWALGVRDSVRTAKAQAGAAVAEVRAAGDVGGDRSAARGHLAAADLHLGRAQDAADSLPMRIAGLLPWVKVPVSDLNHLLAAGDDALVARGLALDIETSFLPGSSSTPDRSGTTSRSTPVTAGTLVPVPGASMPGVLGGVPGVGGVPRVGASAGSPTGEPQPLFAGGAVSLSALADVTSRAEQIVALGTSAERELLAVDGSGIGERGVPDVRDRALREVRGLRQRLEAGLPALHVLRPVLGAQGPRTYLVAFLDQDRMLPWGGAPYAAVTLTLDSGRLTVGAPQLMTATNSVAPSPSPDFRQAAQVLARGWQDHSGQRVDGVLTVDVSAVRELLRLIGPVQVPGYGAVDATGVAQLLLGNLPASDPAQRGVVTGAVLAEVVSRVTSGGDPLRTLQALLAAAPARHVQLWTADAAFEQVALDNGVAGTLAASREGDQLAVYAQGAGTGEVDALQERTVDEVVRLAPDGSATVTRTVTQRNTAVDGGAGRSGSVRTQLVTLLPAGAQLTSAPSPTAGSGADAGAAVLSPVDSRTVDSEGRRVVRQTVGIPAGGVLTWTLSFSVPHLATPEGAPAGGTGMTLPVLLEPDSTLEPTLTRTVVIPPAGWRVGSASGVQVVSGQGVINAALDRPQAFTVPLTKG